MASATAKTASHDLNGSMLDCGRDGPFTAAGRAGLRVRYPHSTSALSTWRIAFRRRPFVLAVPGRPANQHNSAPRRYLRAATLLAILGVDTTTPAGEVVANVMATFAQFERHLIAERTKAALAVKKAQGVQLGRPRTLPDATRARTRRMRGRGMTLAAIAEKLNQDGSPTAHAGSRWYASTVRAVLTAA